MKTEYTTVKNKMIKQIKEFKDETTEENKLIHVHAPFGKGKTILIKDLSSDDDLNIELYDEALQSKEMVDAIFSREGNKTNSYEEIQNNIKRIRRNKMLSKIIFWWFTTVITLTLAMIPIYLNSGISWAVKIIPVLSLFPLGVFSLMKCYYFTERNRSTIVIENIDRASWDVILYALQTAYSSNSQVIFTYSMYNLNARYQEKYNQNTINLYSLIEKYVGTSYDLEKYDETAGRRIANNLKKIRSLENISIDLNKYNNFRLIERSLDFIKENLDVIDKLKKNIQLVFSVYYLSISDDSAFEWLVQKFDDYSKYETKDHKWYDTYSFEMSRKVGNKDAEIMPTPLEVKNSYELVKSICNIYENSNQTDPIRSFILDGDSIAQFSTMSDISKNGPDEQIKLLLGNKDLSIGIRDSMINAIRNDISVEALTINFDAMYRMSSTNQQWEMIFKYEPSHQKNIEHIFRTLRTIMDYKKFSLGAMHSSRLRPSNYMFVLYLKDYLKNIEFFENLDIETKKDIKKFVRKMIKIINYAIKEVSNIPLSSISKMEGWEMHEILIIMKSFGKIKLSDYGFIKKTLLQKGDTSTSKNNNIDADFYIALFSDLRGYLQKRGNVSVGYRIDREYIPIKEIKASLSGVVKHWTTLRKWIRKMTK